jgi:hypothetical protein
MQIARDQATKANIQIFDIYGNLVFFRLLSFVPDEFPYAETLQISGLHTGVYTMIVGVQGRYRIQKFIKHSI